MSVANAVDALLLTLLSLQAVESGGLDRLVPLNILDLLLKLQ
jgi:hypothetical protein